MLFSDLHAKILEDENKASPVDGRRFNKRSRIRMEREVQVINRSIERASRKRTSRKNTHRGIFSEEDIKFEEEENSRNKREKTKETDSVLTEDNDTDPSSTAPE